MYRSETQRGTHLKHVELAGGLLTTSVLAMVMSKEKDILLEAANMGIMMYEFVVNELRIERVSIMPVI